MMKTLVAEEKGESQERRHHPGIIRTLGPRGCCGQNVGLSS